ncbi:MAG: phosphatidate cytidylyltransferase [Phycisphaerales bacterium]
MILAELDPAVTARLFSPSAAFAHPATLPMVAGIGAALVVATVIIEVLGRTGKVTREHLAELRKRTLSWWILAPLMLVPVLLGAATSILAVLVLSIFAYREYARATGLFRELFVSAIVVLGLIAVNLAALDNWYGLFVALFPITIALLAALPILQDQPKGYIQRVGLAVLGFSFFGMCFGHLSYFANDTHFRPAIIFLLITVELNDVFAYCTGKLFGRRKLAPNTSPKKTLGGALGALILTTSLTAWLAHFIFRGTAIDHPLHLAALGLLISIGGQFGDLVMSSIKRDIGIKDLGVLIPGHGGILDRFDSLILVAPLVFHFVRFFCGADPAQAVRIFSH